MEIQLIKRTILVISIISLFLNCKNGNTDNLALSTSNENINYLSENYVTDYRLNIDGSTISDHPFYDYIDCNKEGFFSVHFIAKNQNLRLYWKNEFLAQSNYAYDDTNSENRLIKEKLEENFNDYNIFACHITKEYIKNTQDCTEESIDFKQNSITDIYSYNAEKKNWKLLESRPTDKLPIYYDSKFFEENFSALFQNENLSERTEPLSFYEKNVKYFINKIDVNKDGFDDMVVSSKPYEGDELIFFVKEGNSYQFKLKSVNLSQDGGNIIDSIYAPNSNKGVLAIKTYFPDRGYLTATHYINYDKNDWTLTNTIYETQQSTEKETTTYTCDVEQNLLLKNLINEEYLQQLKYLPKENERDKLCKKTITNN